MASDVFHAESLVNDANRCLDLDDSFPFMLPRWRVDSIPGGFVMISPSEVAKRRRTENGD